MFRIAVVEDEPLTRKAIELALRAEGFDVCGASDAFACRALLESGPIDLVVLDLGLPGLDGMTFAKELRSTSRAGLIVVTRRSERDSRIEALDLGADDYLVKPVDFGELAARIRSVLRRVQPDRGRRKRVGHWIVDLESRTAHDGNNTLALTRGEFGILARLIEANAKIVDRLELSAAISRHPDEADPRSVDALVSRLRRKMDPQPGTSLIATAPGFGYRLSDMPEDA